MTPCWVDSLSSAFTYVVWEPLVFPVPPLSLPPPPVLSPKYSVHSKPSHAAPAHLSCCLAFFLSCSLFSALSAITFWQVFAGSQLHLLRAVGSAWNLGSFSAHCPDFHGGEGPFVHPSHPSLGHTCLATSSSLIDPHQACMKSFM